jgi:hypothetical protein
LVRKTVACEQTLLPIWHGITAVQVRATITATAHISADLYGANPTMWRRPRMLSKSGGATSDAILAVFGSIRTPTVRTISPAGFEKFFRDLADLTTDGAPPFEAIATLAEAYGLQFGEPPWLPDLIARYNLIRSV